MSDTRDQDTGESLAQLREHACRLADELTGSLRRVSVRSGEVTIEVEWQRVGALPGVRAPENGGDVLAAAPAPVLAGAGSGEDTEPPGTSVRSPMVGTFYHASGPDEAPFVEVGDTVREGQTIGIVEAMKLFNPIVSDRTGTVTAILVGNACPVEFDQELVRVAEDAGTGADPANGE